MIENILIFVRNCVMAVLTAWAGIQIAENVQAKKPETTPVATATATAVPMKASDHGSNCPNRTSNGDAPTSAATAGPERTSPTTQPNVMTIR